MFLPNTEHLHECSMRFPWNVTRNVIRMVTAYLHGSKIHLNTKTLVGCFVVQNFVPYVIIIIMRVVIMVTTSMLLKDFGPHVMIFIII